MKQKIAPITEAFNFKHKSRMLVNNPVFIECVEEIRYELYLADDKISLDKEMSREEKIERREENAYLRASLYRVLQKLDSRAITKEK